MARRGSVVRAVTAACWVGYIGCSTGQSRRERDCWRLAKRHASCVLRVERRAARRNAAPPMVSSPDAMTTVLVVEDDPTVAELVRAVINDVPGWGAIVAYDAPSAMNLLEHVRADVLVVDVMLPGLTGIELLAELRTRAAWHDPPVIMMSANVSAQTVERTLGADPAIQFLAK